MRLGFVFLALLAVAGFCTPVLADPANVEPKEWHFAQWDWVRTEMPESEPNDTCPGQAMNVGDVINPAFLNPGEQDWYRFYVTAGQVLTMGTDAVNPGDNTDTYIELYFQCGGSILAQDDDSGPGFYSLISNYTATNTGYYDLKVRGYAGSSTGPYKFFVTTPQPPPANDTCDGAIPIDRCTAGSLQGDLTNYTNNYDPGSGGCADGYAEAGKDAVYLLNLVAGDVVNMTYLQFNYDTAFYIITDCSDPAGSCVIGADATFTGEPETIYWVVGDTGTYYLILDAYGTGAGGAWTLDYAIDCPAPPTGACCINGDCTITTEADCAGDWQGPDTVCDPNPCPPTATEQSTWGRLKSSYR
jgi:hypothetical protein